MSSDHMYSMDTQDGTEIDGSSDGGESTGEEYEVETILDHRVIDDSSGKGKWVDAYHVKWLGYDSDQNSWEPVQNLGNSSALIDDYWKRNPECCPTVAQRRKAKRRQLQQERRAATAQQRSGANSAGLTGDVYASESDDEEQRQLEKKRRANLLGAQGTSGNHNPQASSSSASNPPPRITPRPMSVGGGKSIEMMLGSKGHHPSLGNVKGHPSSSGQPIKRPESSSAIARKRTSNQPLGSRGNLSKKLHMTPSDYGVAALRQQAVSPSRLSPAADFVRDSSVSPAASNSSASGGAATQKDRPPIVKVQLEQPITAAAPAKATNQTPDTADSIDETDRHWWKGGAKPQPTSNQIYPKSEGFSADTESPVELEGIHVVKVPLPSPAKAPQNDGPRATAAPPVTVKNTPNASGQERKEKTVAKPQQSEKTQQAKSQPTAKPSASSGASGSQQPKPSVASHATAGATGLTPPQDPRPSKNGSSHKRVDGAKSNGDASRGSKAQAGSTGAKATANAASPLTPPELSTALLQHVRSSVLSVGGMVRKMQMTSPAARVNIGEDESEMGPASCPEDIGSFAAVADELPNMLQDLNPDEVERSTRYFEKIADANEALKNACLTGNVAYAKSILRGRCGAKVDIEQRDCRHVSLLMLCVARKCTGSDHRMCKVIQLLCEYGAQLEDVTISGTTATMMAAKMNETCKCQMLLQHGATVNRVSTGPPGTDRLSPLGMAVCNGHLEMVRELLFMGADFNYELWYEGRYATAFDIAIARWGRDSKMYKTLRNFHRLCEREFHQAMNLLGGDHLVRMPEGEIMPLHACRVADGTRYRMRFQISEMSRDMILGGEPGVDCLFIAITYMNLESRRVQCGVTGKCPVIKVILNDHDESSSMEDQTQKFVTEFRHLQIGWNMLELQVTDQPTDAKILFQPWIMKVSEQDVENVPP